MSERRSLVLERNPVQDRFTIRVGTARIHHLGGNLGMREGEMERDARAIQRFEVQQKSKHVLQELLIKQSLVFTPFKNMKTVNYSSCPIGFGDFHVEDLVVVVKMCGHIFDINELQMWLQKKNTCPMCRCNIHHGAKIENNCDVSDLLVDIKEMY
jgi:hypothetical protein